MDKRPFSSWGITPAKATKESQKDKTKEAVKNNDPVPRRCKGVLSIDDPHIYDFLEPGKSLMEALTDRRRPTNCIVYGRTLHTYCMIQGLLHRGVAPTNIVLAIPRHETHVNEEINDLIDQDLPIIYPDAFEDEKIEEKIQNMLIDMGI